MGVDLLIIDDDAGDRKLLRRLAARSAMAPRLHEAADPADALTACDRPPDLIFLDQMLPGTSGLSLLPELRARFPDAGIILMTGQGNEETATQAILGGAVDYIAKNRLTAAAVDRLMRRGLQTARMRNQLRDQRQDLETFAQVLVHDLRAPLNSIRGLADMIGESLREGDTDVALKELALVDRSAHIMSELIDSLTAYLRNDRPPEQVATTPQEVLNMARTMLRSELESGDAEVTEDLCPDALICDRAQISQLLQNLLANALRYRGDAPARVRVSARCNGKRMDFCVSDNGPGIPADKREVIFEPFRRLGRDGGSAGTGLGLATCRKILRRHGGHIWCANPAPGETGARFCFTLPLDPAAGPQEAAPQPDRLVM